MRLPKIHIPTLPNRNRVFAIAAVQLMFFSVLTGLPLASWVTANKYKLNSEVLKAVGEAKPELAKKLNFNSETGMYEFNPEGKKLEPNSDDPAEVAKMLQKRHNTGDAKDKGLYSLDLHADSKKGMTVHDNNSGVSVTMVPMFSKGFGRKVQDRLVYPMANGAKAVYTIKNNGLKEDIVFEKSPEHGEVSYEYEIRVPDSLEIRMNDDGGLGVYSADPILFGDISFENKEDEARIKDARRTAQKDHLVFSIPKPIIVAANGDTAKSYAWFELENKILTVHAAELSSIQGAFSIDPTITVTSNSDFEAGNRESAVEFGNDEIKRPSVSGGRLGSFSSGTSLPDIRDSFGSVVYKGNIYIVAGYRDSTTPSVYSSVIYASINSSGVIGTWNTTTSLPTGLYDHAAVAYGGYIYAIGGKNGPGAGQSIVYYSKVNNDGTLQAWNTTTSLPEANAKQASVVHNGYVYVFGGELSTQLVRYAAINGDGTLGTWTLGNALPSGKSAPEAKVYNGRVYVVAGGSSDVVHAKFRDDGTISSWVATTSYPLVLSNFGMDVWGGYMYVVGGTNGSTSISTIRFAEILANGSLGSWVANPTGLPANLGYLNTEIYNGNVVALGGYSSGGATSVATVSVAQVSSAGQTGTYNSTTPFLNDTLTQGTNTGREEHASAVHNGYIYVTGGFGPVPLGSATFDHTQYAPINSDGTIGAWTAGPRLATARRAHTSVVVNGFLYVIGGRNNTTYYNTIEYAPLNPTNGSIGAWTTNTNNMLTPRSEHTTVVHNNLIYSIGGRTTGDGQISSVEFAQVNGQTSGNISAWSTTTSLPSATSEHVSVVANGFIYVFAGSSVRYALLCTGGNSGTLGCTGAVGTIGTWQTNSATPNALLDKGGYFYNGYVYLVGGGGNFAVQKGKVENNGSILAWEFTQNLARGVSEHTVHIYNGYIYVVGGSSSTAVDYSKINNGGEPNTDIWASTGSSLPSPSTFASVVVHNGYIYALGGSASSNQVRFTTINPDNGTLGNWASTTFANIDIQHAFAYRGYIYAVGDGNGNSSSYASINPNGTLGEWNSVIGSGTLNRSAEYDVYNGYLYSSGGQDRATFGNTRATSYAKINNDGSLGAPQAGTNMISFRRLHSMVAANGYLYAIGGLDNSGFNLSSAEYAKINNDGSLGPWNLTNSITTPRFSGEALVHNGYMYFIGGYSSFNTTYYADVQYASILSGGALSEWNTLPGRLTTARSNPGVIANNGYLYTIGGSNGTSLASSEFTSLKSIPRISLYSQSLDFSSGSDLAAISYGGNLRNEREGIFYKVAPDTGVFNSALRPISTLVTACSVYGRHALVNVLLDDRNSGGFPDDLSNRASVQDITVDYTLGEKYAVRPQERLRGGKHFFAEAQTGLDTVKSSTYNSGQAGCNAPPVAATTAVGPNNGTAFSGSGWGSPSNAAANDGQFATITLGENSLSSNLFATGFGFSIPSSATITGIRIEIDAIFSDSGEPYASAVKGGTPIGEQTANAYTNGYYVFG